VLLEALLPRIVQGLPDDGVAYGVAWLARHPRGTVDGLCAALGWSPREVRRRFVAASGFGPKVMQRMLRFQRTLFLADGGLDPADRSLSRLACASGYADQAHMSREFRTLAGGTPNDLLGEHFDVTLRNVFATSSTVTPVPRERAGAARAATCRPG
jgi:methylphosphotriester-DNA--protein-cysteine methyltransferase